MLISYGIWITIRKELEIHYYCSNAFLKYYFMGIVTVQIQGLFHVISNLTTFSVPENDS